MIDADETVEKSRRVTATAGIGWLQAAHKWPGLKSVVMIESTRETQGKCEREARFYIFSLPADAKH